MNGLQEVIFEFFIRVALCLLFFLIIIYIYIPIILFTKSVFMITSLVITYISFFGKYHCDYMMMKRMEVE